MVSALSDGITNLWFTSEVSTVYLVVVYVPSYIAIFEKGISNPVLDA